MDDEKPPLTLEQIAKKKAFFQEIADSEYYGKERKPGRKYYEWVAKKDHALWALRKLENGIDPGSPNGWTLFFNRYR